MGTRPLALGPRIAHNVRANSHNFDAWMVIPFCKLANLSPIANVCDLRQRLTINRAFMPMPLIRAWRARNDVRWPACALAWMRQFSPDIANAAAGIWSVQTPSIKLPVVRDGTSEDTQRSSGQRQTRRTPGPSWGIRRTGSNIKNQWGGTDPHGCASGGSLIFRPAPGASPLRANTRFGERARSMPSSR